jgi:predicted nucleic acid-binding protein
LKRLVIDTNVVLDVLLNRSPNAMASAKVLELARGGKISLFATSECISTSWYVLSKSATRQDARQALATLLKLIHIVPVSHRAVQLALASDFKDLEDAILHFAALEQGTIDAIVTNKLRDFRHSALPVLHPSKVE